jgi:sulfonate transport system substrate-binding protein
MQWRRRFLSVLTACVVLCVSASAFAQNKVKIRIGTHISIAAHLIMQKRPEVLQHLGKSYEVEWVRFAGSADAMPALIAGSLDGCLATPGPMANALFQTRTPLTVVHQLLSFGFDGHYDDATVVRADSGINNAADLKGKIIGVNAIGSTVEQNISIMVRKAGLDPNRNVTFVEGRTPFLPAMLRSNKVQAATLFQPFFDQAMATGDFKVLFTLSDIYGGPTDYVVMVFDDKFLKGNAAAVRDYIADYLLAVNWAFDHRDEAVKLYAEEWKLPLSVVNGYLLTKKDYLVRRDGRLSAKNIQPIIDLLAANGYIPQKFDVAKYIDLSYLPK